MNPSRGVLWSRILIISRSSTIFCLSLSLSTIFPSFLSPLFRYLLSLLSDLNSYFVPPRSSHPPHLLLHFSLLTLRLLLTPHHLALVLPWALSSPLLSSSGLTLSLLPPIFILRLNVALDLRCAKIIGVAFCTGWFMFFAGLHTAALRQDPTLIFRLFVVMELLFRVTTTLDFDCFGDLHHRRLRDLLLCRLHPSALLASLVCHLFSDCFANTFFFRLFDPENSLSHILRACFFSDPSLLLLLLLREFRIASPLACTSRTCVSILL